MRPSIDIDSQSISKLCLLVVYLKQSNLLQIWVDHCATMRVTWVGFHPMEVITNKSPYPFVLLGQLILPPFFFVFWFMYWMLFFFFQNRIKTFYRFFSFILSSGIAMLASLIIKEGVQGLQVFAFWILTVNFKGLNLKLAYVPNCVESSSLKATGIFVILLSQDGCKSNCKVIKSVQNHSSN